VQRCRSAPPDILNLLPAKPGGFTEDIAGNEFPMREGDDSVVVITDNDWDDRFTVRIEQMVDFEKQGYVVAQPERRILKARGSRQAV
jgi:hypothetical protein